MAESALNKLFLLALFLIAVAYFAGLTTDISVAGGVLNQLGNTFTGRNSQGQFQPYPGQS